MNIRISKDKDKLEFETTHGTLVLNVFQNESYPAFNIDFKLRGHEKEPAIPVCMIEDAALSAASSETNGKAIVVRVYGDLNDDEYTHRIDIPIADIEKAYEEDEPGV